MTSDEYVVSELRETKSALSSLRSDLKELKAQNKYLIDDIKFLIGLFKAKTCMDGKEMYEAGYIYEIYDKNKYDEIKRIKEDYEEAEDGNE